MTMHEHTQFYILRTSPAGRLVFYTESDVDGREWVEQREKAHVLYDTYANAVQRASKIHLDSKRFTVAVVPRATFDAIAQWHHDEQGRQRRLHRQQRRATIMPAAAGSKS